MADIGDKYHEADTSYEPETAEYDAAEYQFQIVDLSGDTVALFPLKRERDWVLKLLNRMPIPDDKVDNGSAT